MMRNPDFEKMVAEMRRLQKEYYRRRDSLALRAAKKAEKTVDEYLCRLEPKGAVRHVKGVEYPLLFDWGIAPTTPP